MSRKINILYDLKPALDGYAGIPQETRLLFDALTQLDGVEVQGMIQHGSRQLRPALRTKDLDAPVAYRINRASRFIVSMHEKSRVLGGSEILERWKDSKAEFLLQAATAIGLQQSLSLFQGDLFSDFVWKTFFEKTLDASRRKSTTLRPFRVVRNSRAQFQRVGLRSASERTLAKFPRLNTTGFELVLAQNPFAGAVSEGSKLLVRYHDAVPLLYPHTISDKALHQAIHYQALRSNVASGAHFCCISRATESDLITVFPELERRTSVIPNIVSPRYSPESLDSKRVESIVDARRAHSEDLRQDKWVVSRGAAPERLSGPYLLMVSTIEPRKNHKTLIRAWQRFRSQTQQDVKLILVGSLGWDHKEINNDMLPWIRRGELFHLVNVDQAELRSLYSNALATVCPSIAEGFDYSGIEAMLCDCPVIASGISVHREVFRDAALYFDPYSDASIMEAIRRITSSEHSAERIGLLSHGRKLVSKYTLQAVSEQWRSLLERLANDKVNNLS